MDNPKYIPIEQDLIKLDNNLKQIIGSFDVGFFDSRIERFAVLRNNNYIGATDRDRKHNRWKVRRTLRNSVRLNHVINKKMDKDDIVMLKRALKLTTLLLRIQQYFF